MKSKTGIIFLLVAFFSGCSFSGSDLPLSIAWSHMALSGHFWAATVPSADGALDVHVVDLRDGSEHKVQRAGLVFTAIETHAGEPGHFLLTAKKSSGGASHIIDYDAAGGYGRVILESDHDLRFPFRLGEQFCGLSPTKATTKQRYDYVGICDGRLVDGLSIESASYSAVDKGRAAFTDGTTVLTLDGRTNPITMEKLELPSRFFRSLGYVDGSLIFYDIRSGGVVTVHRLQEGRIVVDTGVLSKRMDAIDLNGVSRVLQVDVDRIVTAHLHKDERNIELRVWDEDGNLISSVTPNLDLPQI
jgi:hypothetical protein